MHRRGYTTITDPGNPPQQPPYGIPPQQPPTFGGQQTPYFPPPPQQPPTQFMPPSGPPPPRKRRGLRITLIAVGSVLGLIVVLGVIGAIVSPKGNKAAASHTPAVTTQQPAVQATSSPVPEFTDPAGELCLPSDVSGGYCPGDSPSPSPPPPPPVTYPPVSSYTWQLVQENPDNYVGWTFTITGTVDQHDANTGTDVFRALAGPASDPYTNTIFDGSGDNSQVAPLQVGQTFTAKVSVEGSISYTLQSGGSTSAPELTVVSLVIG
jgi:hypothetical protein